MRKFFLWLTVLNWAWADPFGGREGCYLLVRVQDGIVIESINPERLEERFGPESTFKVAAAVMAFDAKVMKPNEVFSFRKEGQPSDRQECNQDQTPQTWMTRSVIWVTQVLMRRLGQERVSHYLQQFNYGNCDFSSGLTLAWLNASLKISAHEQALFLGKLIRRQLPVSSKAQEQAQRLLVREQRNGMMLEGKTGSAKLKGGRQFGWYIGHLVAPKQDYIVVCNIADRVAGQTDGPAGFVARSIVKRQLARRQLWSLESSQ